MVDRSKERVVKRKKVNFEMNNGGHTCPNCNFILKREFDYCPGCGQFLDWTDIDEYYSIMSVFCVFESKDGLYCSKYHTNCTGSEKCNFANEHYPDFVGVLTKKEKELWVNKNNKIKDKCIC